jgi:hypothetical protein
VSAHDARPPSIEAAAMRRTLLISLITALLALVLVSAASAAVPPGQQNFQNMNEGLQPRTTWLSNQAFRLKSYYNNQLLGYGHQTFGVDLQWGDHGDWIASLSGHGGTRAITQGDHVALYNTMAKKYLGYGWERFGVDLQWYDTPHYEWQIAGTGANRGLYNTVEHDYLQYGNQTWGIDLVWNFHEVNQDYTEPPDYAPAPPGPQVAYVTLNQALSPSAMHERYSGRLGFQTYHTAVVDEIQNTSQYPISFVGWEYPAPNHCHGPVMGIGSVLSGATLAQLTRDQQGGRTQYDIKSCGAVGGGNGSQPLVRVTYHYVS